MWRSISRGVMFLLLSTAVTAEASTVMAADFHGGFAGHRDGAVVGTQLAFGRGFDDHHFHDDHFRGPEPRRWVGGHWLHDWHDGRLGWWWVVDGFWYFYPAPVYPYPAYGSAPVIQAPPAPPAAVWYYCDNPQGYYPNVPVCQTPWHAVQATPPGPASVPPPG
jgi:hypothetical protein